MTVTISIQTVDSRHLTDLMCRLIILWGMFYLLPAVPFIVSNVNMMEAARRQRTAAAPVNVRGHLLLTSKLTITNIILPFYDESLRHTWLYATLL